jgi:carnitine-CoA ligase
VNGDEQVQESAAIASPSDVCGEEVLLVVTPATLDPAALFGRLRAVLPRHALPAYIVVRPELPKTPTGKVAKHELRVRATDADAWESPAAARRHGLRES